MIFNSLLFINIVKLLFKDLNTNIKILQIIYEYKNFKSFEKIMINEYKIFVNFKLKKLIFYKNYQIGG